MPRSDGESLGRDLSTPYVSPDYFQLLFPVVWWYDLPQISPSLVKYFNIAIAKRLRGCGSNLLISLQVICYYVP